MIYYNQHLIVYINQNEKFFWGEYHYDDHENLTIGLIDNNVIMSDNKKLLKIFYKVLNKQLPNTRI